ncbi:DUF6090 family protein [Psychroserpens algicola]|uniref:DUF6090 family protein n=1 Tax=Psychroserpens algicola TaxID=1719034 RepID=A0ABT0H9Y9_9FLAO|nr:DUF6090 family protein [Psychroserpens algicola]MCK8481178.1 DUF6090 family protein [Psychroserpens algicola]
MIKFFRRIRQSLLSENKFSKYLIYAVGEIILVVIGILIALQINNWNENRKLNLQEQTALNNIHRDFLKNKAILEDIKTSTELIMKHGVQILNHTGSKTKPDSEDIFNSWLNELYNSTPYYPQNGFLDDLLSSGKLSIFKNAELRNLLSSWKPEVEILEERFSTVDKNEDILNTYIIEHGSWLNADQVSENTNVTFPVSGFTVDNRDLLKVLQFENLVENLVIAAGNYYSTQKKTEKLLDDINTLLETEIQKQQ